VFAVRYISPDCASLHPGNGSSLNSGTNALFLSIIHLRKWGGKFHYVVMPLVNGLVVEAVLLKPTH
jgi:hypothetical protein